MLPLRNVKLCRLDTVDDIAIFQEWLKQPRPALSFDCETTGLEWWRPEFRTRLVQFGDSDRAFVLRADRFGVVIEDVFANYPGTFVSHNGVGFDGHVLKATGFSLPPIHRWRDTLMQSRIIDSRGSHRLKDLAEKRYGPAASMAEKALMKAFKLHGFGNDKGRGYAEIPFGVKAYDVYSGVDVILGARLDIDQWPIIESLFREQYETEMASWWVTFEHEEQGLPVDLEYAEELAGEYTHRRDVLRDELRQIGIKNPSSKPQRLDVLYREGFEPDDFTETGEPVLDKAVLEKFASPTAQMLVEFGRLDGWLTKYINKVREGHYNGRVYPSFNPFGARTGRQSAYGPPVQQLPGRHEEAPKIRRLFLPRPDEELWSIDYDGQENRLLAHYSHDEALIKIITEGLDIHTYIASIVYDIPYEDVSKEQRKLIKNVVYAEQYGAGVAKMAKMLDMPYEQVAAIRDGIKRAFPGVQRWKQEVEDEATVRWNTEGAAYSYTWGGRRVYADQYEEFEPKYYTLANYILQGSGADVLKTALNRIAAAGLSKYIYLPVHDELLFSLPTGPEGVELADELARLMTFEHEFLIPLTCSPEGPFPAWSPH